MKRLRHLIVLAALILGITILCVAETAPKSTNFAKGNTVNSAETKKPKNPLFDTVVGDEYRQTESAVEYNNVYISGNFAMERVSITDEAAKDYAQIINNIADKLPKKVNIYSIVIPTSSEFYGPVGVYTDQTSGIKTVYENLSERVIPINAVKPLYAHADEDIYFRTDHHWTQRGAYYVYEEFAKASGKNIAPLSSFEVSLKECTGSLADFTKGTYGETLIRSNPDMMEKFSAPTYTAGAAYNDMYMQEFIRTLAAVYQSSNGYISFIGGDNPLSVFTTNVKNGKKLVILKESFGNAFATWALNNYSEVYVIDVRRFNSNGNPFNLKKFYDFVKYDDLVIINYPVSVTSSKTREYLSEFIK